jgi:hypothetical protein
MTEEEDERINSRGNSISIGIAWSRDDHAITEREDEKI